MLELNIKNLNKNYKNTSILKNFSIKIGCGITALLAPNGAGKTTLLKIISTSSDPSGGDIYLKDESIFNMGKKYRSMIGYLPQKFGVYPNFTAEKFLKYFGTLKGIPKAQLENRIDYLLEKVSLLDFKKKKLKTFSGGMIRRIGIAQALLNNPKILILDEPTVGLDPDERIKFRNFLVELNEDKDKIIILSTHIVSDIEEMADKILFMKNGKLLNYTTTCDAILNVSSKIYEVLVPKSECSKIKDKYFVTKCINKKDGMFLRIIGDNPYDTAVEVEPNLEDVYVYYYNMVY
ncbi:ATP-binding cassette domain-containing protein [Clostridium oceanicum]|uniref:ABC transporter ATP-binding protein n=1 Tax=Clostridium oceanicum TaxID=1543 RepID=A0ABP3UQS4_9CLOT